MRHVPPGEHRKLILAVPVELRNVPEPVELFAAVSIGEARQATLPCDPVCRMAVDPDRAVGRLVYEDTTYFFCSLACAAQFAQHPARYGR